MTSDEVIESKKRKTSIDTVEEENSTNVKSTTNAESKSNAEISASSDTSVAEASTPKACAHWVYRKKRFCKMTVSEGREYCGEHLPAVSSTTTETAVDADRIPCPLDEKHTIYRKNLRKHLKICNARQKDDVPAYIVKNVNAVEREKDAKDHSQIKLRELNDEEFYDTINKIKSIYENFIEGKIELLELQHNSLADELANDNYGKGSKKQLLQTSALLGILEHENQLQHSTSFIEFGAGKGQLAFYLVKLLDDNSQVILLDRMSLRHKKDNKIENKSLVQRIRADIADFEMCHLDLLKKTQRNVAVSKHLCGVATDLTLRCITNANAAGITTEFIMIALCCHHLCDWHSFVGKKFLESQNITPRQFMIITKMVGWAICGTGMSRERRKNLIEQSLSPEDIAEISTLQRVPLSERTNIGFMCKRVLDYARLKYLHENDYEAELKYYVPSNVTPENVCLLAKKRV